MHLPLTVVDPLLVAGFALVIAHAARQSFVPYLTELIAFGLGLWASLALFQPVGGFIHAHLGVSPGVAGFGSFLLILVIVHALVQAPVSVASAWTAAHLRPLLSPDAYMWVSAVPAAGMALMTSTVLLCALAVLPLNGARALVTGSLLGSAIEGHAGFVQAPVQKLLVPPAAAAQPILESDPVKNPGEDAFLKLRFPANLAIDPDPSGEDHMLQRLNEARAQAGLSPLRSDPQLQQAAREHSADMYRRDYFSHRTPDGKTPYDRLHDLRFHYVTAGENIAFAPDPDQAWDSLMTSPDHRANILNPDFRCVGIGAYKGQNGYEEMFTQDFADCS